MTTFLLFAALKQTLFMLALGGMAIFLILLVLVQRGRGGGLAGALGGMGGSSAFGAKAGDVFTKITIVTATVWIVLCIAAAKWTPSEQSRLDVSTDVQTETGGSAISSVAGEEGEEAAGDEAASEATSDAEPAAGSEPESGEEAK